MDYAIRDDVAVDTDASYLLSTEHSAIAGDLDPVSNLKSSLVQQTDPKNLTEIFTSCS
jgi:hypothetical protein